MNSKEKKALARLETIIKVRMEQMTVTEAAQELGVSRKTWYQWEERGLKAIVESLSDRDPGRPRRDPDPEKDALLEQMIELKKQNILLQQSLDINRILNQAHDETTPSSKTRTPRGPSSKKRT